MNKIGFFVGAMILAYQNKVVTGLHDLWLLHSGIILMVTLAWYLEEKK